MRLKFPISLAEILFYKGFQAIGVMFTQKSKNHRASVFTSSKDFLRFIYNSRSFQLMITISPKPSDWKSVTNELLVRRDELKPNYQKIIIVEKIVIFTV